MKAWNHDPQKLLLMNLKLVKGVQFSNPLGEILASIPNALPATIITKWQYRMMLSLDGNQQFLEVVREVKNDYAGDFTAEDVWQFLDWLIENDLVEAEEMAGADGDSEANSSGLPNVIAPTKTRRPWYKMPLQSIAAISICLIVAFSTYFMTPFLLAIFAPQDDTMQQEDVPVVFAQAIPVKTETKAVRIPKIAETEEVVVAGRSPIVEELPPLPEEPSLVEKLIEIRQQMAACQIRRDEYILLKDEKGYRAEAAKIDELAEEIELIRDGISQ